MTSLKDQIINILQTFDSHVFTLESILWIVQNTLFPAVDLLLNGFISKEEIRIQCCPKNNQIKINWN